MRPYSIPTLDHAAPRDLVLKGTAVAIEAQGLILLDVETSARQTSLPVMTTVTSVGRPAKIVYLPVTRPAAIVVTTLTRSHQLDRVAIVRVGAITLGPGHLVVGVSFSSPRPRGHLQRTRITVVLTRTSCRRALLTLATAVSMPRMLPLALAAEAVQVVAGTSPAQCLRLPSASVAHLWDPTPIEGNTEIRSTTAPKRHRMNTARTRQASTQIA